MLALGAYWAKATALGVWLQALLLVGRLALPPACQCPAIPLESFCRGLVGQPQEK